MKGDEIDRGMTPGGDDSDSQRRYPYASFGLEATKSCGHLQGFFGIGSPWLRIQRGANCLQEGSSFLPRKRTESLQPCPAVKELRNLC